MNFIIYLRLLSLMREPVRPSNTFFCSCAHRTPNGFSFLRFMPRYGNIMFDFNLEDTAFCGFFVLLSTQTELLGFVLFASSGFVSRFLFVHSGFSSPYFDLQFGCCGIPSTSQPSQPQNENENNKFVRNSISKLPSLTCGVHVNAARL